MERKKTLKRLIAVTEAELGNHDKEIRYSSSGSSVSLGPFYASALGLPPELVRRIARAHAQVCPTQSTECIWHSFRLANETSRPPFLLSYLPRGCNVHFKGNALQL